MQNSLARLLEGTAVAMREHVQPHLDDEFARSQVRAAIELLGNLSTRVAWRPDYLLATIERARRVLEVGVALAPAGALVRVRAVLGRPVPPGHDVEGLTASRGLHLEAFAEVQLWAGARPPGEVARLDEAITAFLRWQLDDELARLRTASFGR